MSAIDIHSCASKGMHATALTDIALFLGYGPGQIKMQSNYAAFRYYCFLKSAQKTPPGIYIFIFDKFRL
jgi:hypothetical protein